MILVTDKDSSGNGKWTNEESEFPYPVLKVNPTGQMPELLLASQTPLYLMFIRNISRYHGDSILGNSNRNMINYVSDGKGLMPKIYLFFSASWYLLIFHPFI